MSQHAGLARVSLLVSDYDEAIDFYINKLGFELIEDTPLAESADAKQEFKRWVVITPKQGAGAELLLAQASTDEQRAAIGRQGAGRVMWFLSTDDFWRDFYAFTERGVIFHELPRTEPYGTVAVFEDLYGNLWDLLEPENSR